ncbi:MAG: YceD family protein [Actinomycetota bacterium]|nr:YceD family protein [Actinomycetota bacterium]
MPEKTTPTRHGSNRADPRNPFVIDIREVGRRPGSMREYRRSVPAPTGLALDLIGVPQGAPLAVDIRLESVTEGVLVTGSATGPLTGECGRCLDPVSDELIVDFCELFAYPDSATDETTEQDEVHRLDGDYLDVEPVVRDAVVLGLPFAPLCRPDCPGLCPTCGQRLDGLPPGHTHDVLDPRWAALAAFTDAAEHDPEAPAEVPDQLD